MKLNWIAATFCVGFSFLATVVSPQGSTNRLHIGVPQDWSQRHIVFSRDGLLQHPDLLYREPRVLHQAIQRFQSRDSSIVSGIDAAQASSALPNKRDWSFNLPGRVASNMFPAKFSFDPALTPDCTNDFVVFGLTNTGVSGRGANLVAFNNLYAGSGGLCGSAPTEMFAYNVTTTTGSGIHTSPVLSYPDAKKIAFVESTPGGPPGSSIFHVLTWTAGQGTAFAAATPTMTSLTLASDNNTTSSPWVDYFGDIAYVGTDDGVLHKITGVFNGTPTEVKTAGWPIIVSRNSPLTSPVVDGNLLLVGSANGQLYQINLTTGTSLSVIIGRQGGGKNANAGFHAAPILDVTSGTAFVVNSNDGTSGVLIELNTATLATIGTARIGIASASGTPVDLWEPALSNNYFTNASTGHIRLCGTGNTDVSPYLYSFGFDTSGVLQPTATGAIHLTSSTAASCTAVTEFFHCNNTKCTVGNDFFFLGLTTDCTGTGTSGCVIARSSSTPPLSVDIPGGPSGIVVDNYSTAAQASSIYFMADKQNTAYKFTQNGLQ